MTSELELAKIMEESLLNQCFIHIRYMDGMKVLELAGMVTVMDRQLRRTKISHVEGMEWIEMDDILHVRLQPD